MNEWMNEWMYECSGTYRPDILGGDIETEGWGQTLEFLWKQGVWPKHWKMCEKSDDFSMILAGNRCQWEFSDFKETPIFDDIPYLRRI